MGKKLLKLVTLWLVALPIAAAAQSGVVTGRVTDASTGEELPGANVYLLEIKRGASTDINGRYVIPSVPAGNFTLVASFLGYKQTRSTITVGTSEVTADIVLEPDNLGFDEVVVTALGVERDKKSLGFGTQTVAPAELTVARTTNVVNALAGKVAGVRVQASNGMVGSGAAVFIRGFTTFTQSNQPLFVVDGIPIDNGGGGNALQNGVSNSNRAIDINQDDIESMTVLKGPAAAVLYGSRAASGAIVITTKKGKAADGKSTINYTFSNQFDQVNRFPDWQTEYGAGQNGIYNPISFQSWGPKFGAATIPGTPIVGGNPTMYPSDAVPLAPNVAAAMAQLGRPTTTKYQAYPNNVRDLFKTGTNTQHNISISGTHGKGNYNLSYGNLEQTGVLDNNSLVRHNFRLTASNQVTKKLNTNISVQHILSKSQRTQIGNQLSNPLFRGWFVPKSYDLTGLPFENLTGNNVYFDNVDNPYWTIKNNLWDDDLIRTIGNVGFDYTINDWLSFNYKVGTDTYTNSIRAFDQIGAIGGANTSAAGQGGISNQSILSQDLYSYANLVFNKNLTQDIKLNVLLGNEIAQLGGRSNSVTGRTLAVPSYRNMSNATVFIPGESRSRSRLVGVYADAAISYKDYLTVNVTGRNDWSSTFSKENNSYFYPSVAFSFVLTEAVKSLKSDFLTYLKFRGNRATVGRTAPVYNTATYFFQASVGDGFVPGITFPFGTLPGFTYANGAGNVNIGPEFTTSREVGFEMGLFKDRLGFDVTYYNSSTTDIILSAPISNASGNTSTLINAGELSSKGWEVLVRFAPIKTRDFSWDINVNWTRNRTIVESLAPGVTSLALGGFVTPQTRLQVGDPYGILFGNYYQRNEQGQYLINPATGLPLISSGANANKRIGNPNPDWTGGLTNTINFKGFNLTMVFDIRQGGDLISRNVLDMRRYGAGTETTKFERFNADGTPTRPYVIPGVYASAGTVNGTPVAAGDPNTVALTVEQYWTQFAANGGVAETYVFDGSWRRLRELSFSYMVPRRYLKETPLSMLEIGVNGRNLWLNAPNYPHFDPEQNAQGVSNSQGLEFNALPQTKSFGFFLRTSF
jgi:TonB-linked SusC/RagA family outer membrane protein